MSFFVVCIAATCVIIVAAWTFGISFVVVFVLVVSFLDYRHDDDERA